MIESARSGPHVLVHATGSVDSASFSAYSSPILPLRTHVVPGGGFSLSTISGLNAGNTALGGFIHRQRAHMKSSYASKRTSTPGGLRLGF